MTTSRAKPFPVTVVPPSLGLESAYAGFIEEYLRDVQEYYTVLHEVYGIAGNNVRRLIEFQRAWSLGQNLPDGWVPCTTLWAKHEDQIVGEVNIRHRLVPVLEEYGGQIGYYVLPAFRGGGIASQLLAGALGIVKALDLKQVLICCDEKNVTSRGIIERAGGRLLERRDNRAKWGQYSLRYVIGL